MNLNTVKYFLAVCDEGSFTRAAACAGIAQPSLSVAIKRLEDELGGSLFDRYAGRVRLTDFGRLLRPWFLKLDRCADDLRRTARIHNQRRSASIRLPRHSVHVRPSSVRRADGP